MHRLFYILFFLLIFRLAFAQNDNNALFTIDIQQGSTKELLRAISLKTGIVFSYSNQLCHSQHVVLSSNKNSLEGFIHDIFKQCKVNIIYRPNKVILQYAEDQPDYYQLKGFVTDSISGEYLAKLLIKETIRGIQCQTNNQGYFVMQLPQGRANLTLSFSGKEQIMKPISINRDTLVRLEFSSHISLEEVEISQINNNEGFITSSASAVSIPIEQINKLPSFLGEPDVVKAIQMVPGIQSGTEGTGGIYVRGGGPDQNLIMLDGVPLYNVSHLMGYFSVFNTDAINSMTVYKGGFPAQYSGRLSSVVDITTNSGNNERLKGSFTLGLLSSKLSLDGPVKKEVSNFSLSMRRTYLDLLYKPITVGDDQKSGYYFFDVNGKYCHRLSSKDRMFFTFYWGKDKLYTQYNSVDWQPQQATFSTENSINVYDENRSDWGTFLSSLRWSHTFSENCYLNTTAYVTDYNYSVSVVQNNFNVNSIDVVTNKFFSGIRDYGFKSEVNKELNEKHQLKAGAKFIYHQFNPGIDLNRTQIAGDVSIDTTYGGTAIAGRELSVYVQDNVKLSPKLDLHLGLNWSNYFNNHKWYSNPEPRLSLNYKVSSLFSVNGSYTRMAQYTQLLSTSKVSMPADLWLPSTDKIEPMTSNLWSVGMEFEPTPKSLFSMDAYYKNMNNLIEYKDNNYAYNYFDDWSQRTTTGSGYAYGVELLFQHSFEKLSFTTGYAISRSRVLFSELNNGKEYPAKYDRLHDFSCLVNYAITNRFDVSASWFYATGYPISVPTQQYEMPQIQGVNATKNQTYNYIENKNSARMSSFHRLDMGSTYTSIRRWGTVVWRFGVYNVYGHQNPYYVYIENDAYQGSQTQLKQFSLLPTPIPYISATISF